MLTKINENAVTSTDGYALTIRSAERQLKYEEGDHHLLIGEDFGETPAGKYYMIVYLNTLRNWEPPYADESLEPAAIGHILKNIEECLTFLGIPHEFYRPPKQRVEGTRLESEDGYTVAILSKGRLRYTEGTRMMSVGIQRISGGGLKILVSDLKRWDPPYDQAEVSQADLLLISQRILEACARMGIDPVVLEK